MAGPRFLANEEWTELRYGNDSPENGPLMTWPKTLPNGGAGTIDFKGFLTRLLEWPKTSIFGQLLSSTILLEPT